MCFELKPWIVCKYSMTSISKVDIAQNDIKNYLADFQFHVIQVCFKIFNGNQTPKSIDEQNEFPAHKA